MRLNRGNVRMIVKPKISVAGTAGAFYILILATTCEAENIIIPISKTEAREVEQLTQGHTASQWWRWDLNPVPPA